MKSNILIFSISSILVFLLFNSIASVFSNNPKYILVFDVDGTITHIPGEKQNSAYFLPLETLEQSKNVQFLFNGKQKYLTNFFKELIPLVKNGTIKIHINSNNTSERIKLIFQALDINLSDLIKSPNQICRTRDNAINYSKGDCLQKLLEKHSKEVPSTKNILFFEDDPRYVEEIPKEITWINCQNQFLGNHLEKHFLDSSLIDFQGSLNFLQKLIPSSD